jgi:hypothetical protein
LHLRAIIHTRETYGLGCQKPKVPQVSRYEYIPDEEEGKFGVEIGGRVLVAQAEAISSGSYPQPCEIFRTRTPYVIHPNPSLHCCCLLHLHHHLQRFAVHCMSAHTESHHPVCKDCNLSRSTLTATHQPRRGARRCYYWQRACPTCLSGSESSPPISSSHSSILLLYKLRHTERATKEVSCHGCSSPTTHTHTPHRIGTIFAPYCRIKDRKTVNEPIRDQK